MKNRFNHLVTCLTLVVSAQLSFGQTQNASHNIAEAGSICGTEKPSQQWEAQFQQLIQKTLEQGSTNKTQGVAYTIPVIIHVIHGGQSVGSYPNLAQGQLNSQIQVLNNDFGGIGFNSGNYPATAFTTFAANQNIPQANLDAFGRIQIANCNIQFCLATKDSLGNILPEPGIERINYVSKGWTNPGSFTNNANFQTYFNSVIKPQTIWNVSKYMNIWVSDIGNAASLLGYATFPPLSGISGIPNSSAGNSTTDGFWCLARAFGSQSFFPSGVYQTGYTRGRTSTHEIGHYLGLRHTWGDGTCASDFCNDTPPAFDNNFGSPVYPLNATGTNSCFSAVNGAMFMNFMDYTDDPAKYMFTTDQATRIQTAMGNSPYRKFLGTHNLCSVATIAATSQFNLPARACGSAVITPTNNSSGTPVPSYTWSSAGGAIFSPNANVASPAISFPSPGVYTITLAVENGSTSVSSKTINAFPSPNLVLTTPTMVCLNDLVTITASGANTYAWLPLFIVTPSVSYVASVDRTFTVTATDANQCKKIDSVTVYVSECLGIENGSRSHIGLSIFPNPAHTELQVSMVSAAETEAAITITDAIGRIVLQQTTQLKAGKNNIRLAVENFANGIYLLRVTAGDGNQVRTKFLKE